MWYEDAGGSRPSSISGDALRIWQAGAVFGAAGMEIAGMNGGESTPIDVPSVVD